MAGGIKSWVPVDGDVVVHYGFDAAQSYIDNYEAQVVEREDRTTPPWYHEGVTFLDVTAMNPKPTLGSFKQGNQWLDGNPSLTVDDASIPADGAAVAKVTFTQKGPQAPANVTFDVNGQLVPQALANGVATLDVTSTNPGDVIIVHVGELSVMINVEV